MKVLIYGAGVLGSLYAARLQESGNQVSLLARGQRLKDLRAYGILYEDARGGFRHHTNVEIVEKITPEDTYDLIIVLVRKNQLPGVLRQLASNQNCPNILIMSNNPAGTEEMARALGRERILLGFPGAGGTMSGPLVRYIPISRWLQPTALGELDGKSSERVFAIASMFQKAGFPVALYKDMDAYLRTHAAWVSPVANAIYLADGSVNHLAHTPDGLVLMVRAIRENFRVLNKLGIHITPSRYALVGWLPEPLLIAALKQLFHTQLAKIAFEQHANRAREDEMIELAEDLSEMARLAHFSTPASDRLADYINPIKPAMPPGSAKIAKDWREMWVIFWILLGMFGWHWFTGRRK